MVQSIKRLAALPPVRAATTAYRKLRGGVSDVVDGAQMEYMLDHAQTSSVASAVESVEPELVREQDESEQDPA